MADTPEKLSKYRCPKCGSDKVAEGSGNKDNVCQECGKEWPHEAPEALTQCEAKLLGFKKPHVLLTVNQDLRRTQFEGKLDAALGIIIDGLDNSHHCKRTTYACGHTQTCRCKTPKVHETSLDQCPECRI